LKSGAPDDCRAGFASISVNAAENAFNGLTLSQNELDLEKKFDGGKLDLTKDPSQNQTAPSSVQTSESSASIAGTTGGKGTKGNSKSNLASALSSTKSMLGGGTGSTAGGSSGGMGENGLDGSGGDSADSGANTNGSASKSGEKSNAGAFASDGQASGAGSDGGKGGDYASKVSSGLAADTDLTASGNPDGSSAQGAVDEDGDRDPLATADDPEDYFNRIDKTASIFKIVSKRYMKKKSLWKEGQKHPEDLKRKQI
jgi:hypothetical protein